MKSKSRSAIPRRPLQLTLNAMLYLAGVKLDWFDEKGKFIPFGRAKPQDSSHGETK